MADGALDYYCPACDRRWLLTEPCGHIAIAPSALERLRVLVSELTAQGARVQVELPPEAAADVAIAGTWTADGFSYTFMHPALLPTFRARLLRVLAARAAPATAPRPRKRSLSPARSDQGKPRHQRSAR
jgi:hypothetical protein